MSTHTISGPSMAQKWSPGNHNTTSALSTPKADATSPATTFTFHRGASRHQRSSRSNCLKRSSGGGRRSHAITVNVGSGWSRKPESDSTHSVDAGPWPLLNYGTDPYPLHGPDNDGKSEYALRTGLARSPLTVPSSTHLRHHREDKNRTPSRVRPFSRTTRIAQPCQHDRVS